MSFVQTVQSIFGGAASQQTPGGVNPAQQNPAASAATANPTVPSAATTPPAGAIPNQPEGESPLAQYDDLWQTEAAKPNEPLFKLDPKKLQESVSKLDFRKVVNTDDLAAINAGGESATQALLNVMNKFSQAATANQTAITTQLISSAMEKNNSTLESRLPSMMRSQNVNELTQKSNPLLKSAAAAPVVQALSDQMQRKYPAASAEEINSHVMTLLGGFADAIKAPELAAKQAKNPGEDWSSFLE